MVDLQIGSLNISCFVIFCVWMFPYFLQSTKTVQSAIITEIERVRSHSDHDEDSDHLETPTVTATKLGPRHSADDHLNGVLTGVGVHGAGHGASHSASPLPIPTKSGMHRQRSNSSTGTSANGEHRVSESHSNSQFSIKMSRMNSHETGKDGSDRGTGQRRLSISELRKRVKAKKAENKKKQGLVHKFLPVMLKMTILSLWCALSTVLIFGIMGGIYPTLSGVVDSLINGICVYLSFGFTRRIYGILCLPILACKDCAEYVNVVKEADEMNRNPNYEQEQSVLG